MAKVAEAVIADAQVAPGHDGEAVLVVRVRHENGAHDSVTLRSEAARKLMADCSAVSLDDLRGQPWQRLLEVLEA